VKADVLTYIDKTVGETPSAPASLAPNEPESRPEARPAHAREERVRMTRLRRTVGESLREAQRTAAMLTTFNEVDMSAVMALRAKYQDEYQSRHGVKLGFMSFFVRAVVVALRDVPSVNAQIDGEDIVYKNHYDIGVAVSAPQGLVVPVVRDADALHFADIEKRIADLAKRARDGRLTLDEIQGGTFTITNGGVFGSLLSTPILNPPQSGILGMHKIENRPVALGDQVVVRPMMYLALTYDHRLVDGREAVTFLVRVKECVEVPDRLLLDL
jgi:2-oxoglutarate dehydrogenase E2 component (dihydrolipoamide succinyltransferase)